MTKTISFNQALITVILSLGGVITGKLFLSLDITIALLLAAVVTSCYVALLGVKWDDIETEICRGIGSMSLPMIILVGTGILVGVWMTAGVIPMMMYWGLKLLTPQTFLIVTCFICTLMSLVSGTSWGTIATSGVALLGVGMGLGVPVPHICGAIVVGAFFGDKLSPLSDSTILSSASCNVPLVEHIKHMLWTTIPAYACSIVLFLFLGAGYEGAIAGAEYESLLTGLQSTFKMSIFSFLPPVIVFYLVAKGKPALVAFTAGIFTAVALGMIIQGHSFTVLCNAMANGCSIESGNALVDKLIHRGGMSSMFSTVAIMLGASVFVAPVRASGAAEVLFNKVEELSKTPARFMIACYIIHPIFNLVAASYYVTFPVMGGFTAPVFDKLGLSRANLSRTFEDTGTIMAPLIPWEVSAIYIYAQLGVHPGEYWMYAPMCWLGIVFGILLCITGIGIKKSDGTYVRPILWQKRAQKV